VHPEQSHLVHHEAVTRTETVVDAERIQAVLAVEEASHVETFWTRSQDTAPDGDGWAEPVKAVETAVVRRSV
jgi:hypothetical protein